MFQPAPGRLDGSLSAPAASAEDLGISDRCLRGWMKQADIEEGRREGLSNRDRDELVELRRELRVTKVENEILKPFVDRKLARAFNNPDPVAGLRAAKELAALLEDKHPDATASLREGLDDMFTVRRLGLSDRLCRTLTNTNTIESILGRAHDDPQREALA